MGNAAHLAGFKIRSAPKQDMGFKTGLPVRFGELLLQGGLSQMQRIQKFLRRKIGAEFNKSGTITTGKGV